MPTRTLVIDGTDLQHFLLAVETGTVRVGDPVRVSLPGA